jgi:FHA domain
MSVVPEVSVKAVPQTHIRIGQGIGIVAEHTLALLEAFNGLLAEDLWQLVESGAGIDDLLESLSATGLRSLGSFAMAQYEDDGIRLVVRGSATIDVETADGTSDVQAEGVRTWVEHFVPGECSVTLRLEQSPVAPLPFCIRHGLVPADLLRRTLHITRSELSDVDIGWLKGFEPPLVAGSPKVQSTIATPADPDDIADELFTPLPVANNLANPIIGASSTESDSTSVPLLDIDHGRTISSAQFQDYATPQQSGWGAPPTETAVEPDRDYDDYFGHTVARSVQGAAVFVAEETPPEPQQPVSTPDTAARYEPPPTGGQPMLIVGVPNSSAAGGLADFVDLDGHTMTKAQLAALRSGSLPSAGNLQETVMGGPTVQAVMCHTGHPNPPGVGACARCGQPVFGQPTVISRPRLGQLRLDNGEVIGLDRPLLIGRKPKLEGRMLSEMPQIVELSNGQGLSRTHAMIKLEGWHVLIEDLGSANGTIVTLPGREPRRLHEGEPALLEVGAQIDFGGEVSASYEWNP